MIITKRINQGKRIVSDGWMGYYWLSAHNSGYVHITHIHVHGYFGYGEESTSNIESVWANLKSYIKRIYNFIPYQNLFVIFTRI